MAGIVSICGLGTWLPGVQAYFTIESQAQDLELQVITNSETSIMGHSRPTDSWVQPTVPFQHGWNPGCMEANASVALAICRIWDPNACFEAQATTTLSYVDEPLSGSWA